MVLVFPDVTGHIPTGQGLPVGQRSRGAGLDALAAEGAGRVLEDPVELHGDAGVEAPVRHGDGVVPFLLGAHPDAPVAGDAVVVVPQNEGVRVIRPAPARPAPPEAAGPGLVPVQENRELLGGKAREGVDVEIPVLRGHHLQKHAPVGLELLTPSAHHHPVLGPGGAGGHRLRPALHLHDAEATSPEGFQARIVAQGGNLPPVPLRDLDRASPPAGKALFPRPGCSARGRFLSSSSSLKSSDIPPSSCHSCSEAIDLHR